MLIKQAVHETHSVGWEACPADCGETNVVFLDD